MVGTNENYDEWRQVSGNKVTDDPTEKLHNRLRAILERTRSSNEAEAATAAHLLQKFLIEHNLSVADLEKKGKAAPGMREEKHDLGKAAFKWKLDLADGIAEFYYCAPLVDRRAKSVQFIGRPENVEALVMLYGWVIDQIKAIATEERRKHFDKTQEHIDPLRWQLGFGEGAVQRLINRLREMKTRQQEDLSRNDMGDVTALAIHHQAEVSDYLEKTRGYRVDGRLTKREQESEARWKRWQDERDAAAVAKDTMRIQCEASGDMEPFYEKYPDERPEEVERRQKAQEKADREYDRRERRNARRRTGPAWRPEKEEDEGKIDQQRTARAAGRMSADRINLQPFISDGGKPGAKKVGG